MRNRYIKTITIIGIISIFILQLIWLLTTFKLTEDQLNKKICESFDTAAFEEATSHFAELPKDTKVIGAPRIDSMKKHPEVTSLLQSLSSYGITNNINAIDSIYKSILSKSNIKTDLYIDKIKNGCIIETTKKGKIPNFGIMKTQLIPIRTDESLGIQATLLNPYYVILEHMGLIIIATLLTMAFIIGCIIYQIKIVIKQNKIFQIREDFSHAMIHDMKTPLSTIFMTLNFLHSGRLDDKPEMKDKYYKIAESEADHLLTLTNKVLTISKLEKHKLEIAKEEVQLAPMIEKLTEKFSTKASKPVHFTVNLKATEAYADREYLEEVISNLIDNAVKYSKESVEIQIGSDSNKLYTILKVHDNGLGISKEDQRIIFHKYERAAATRRNRKGGAAGFGLGLNFVDQVITAHEGKIIVSSIEGEFTEFIIYLPQIIQKI